jgi:hypothetical protein
MGVLGGVIYVAGNPGRIAGITAVSKLLVGWAAAAVPDVMLVISSGSWLDNNGSPRPGPRPASSLLILRLDNMMRRLRAFGPPRNRERQIERKRAEKVYKTGAYVSIKAPHIRTPPSGSQLSRKLVASIGLRLMSARRIAGHTTMSDSRKHHTPSRGLL